MAVTVIGAAAYYGVSQTQHVIARRLLTEFSPMIDCSYIIDLAANGLSETQILLSECYRQGVLLPHNIWLAEQQFEIAHVKK